MDDTTIVCGPNRLFCYLQKGRWYDKGSKCLCVQWGEGGGSWLFVLYGVYSVAIVIVRMGSWNGEF